MLRGQPNITNFIAIDASWEPDCLGPRRTFFCLTNESQRLRPKQHAADLQNTSGQCRANGRDISNRAADAQEKLLNDGSDRLPGTLRLTQGRTTQEPLPQDVARRRQLNTTLATSARSRIQERRSSTRSPVSSARNGPNFRLANALEDKRWRFPFWNAFV